MSPHDKTSVVKHHFDTPKYLTAASINIEARCLAAAHFLRESIADKDVLDIGCGDGSLSIQFLDKCKSLTLLDASSNMLRIAKENIPDSSGKKLKWSTYLLMNILVIHA